MRAARLRRQRQRSAEDSSAAPVSAALLCLGQRQQHDAIAKTTEPTRMARVTMMVAMEVQRCVATAPLRLVVVSVTTVMVLMVMMRAKSRLRDGAASSLAMAMGVQRRGGMALLCPGVVAVPMVTMVCSNPARGAAA